jgi:hypothetical protein
VLQEKYGCSCMPRSPTHFRQRDLRAAVAALIAAGLKVVGVKIDPTGAISITTTDKTDDKTATTDANSWDEVLSK